MFRPTRQSAQPPLTTALINMQIRLDDLKDPRVHALLQLHLDEMAPTAPAESRHALDLSGLQHPSVSFWCLWDAASGAETLAGIGALKALDDEHAEIKSMRTAPAHLRRGVAATVLTYILAQAKQRGFKQVSLETGSMDYFAPARALYERAGFTECPPFGDYKLDPNSVFMTKRISD
jgi:putative acetyltransferase